MIETVIENALHSKLSGIMVVTGSDRDPLLRVIGKLPVRNCHNMNFIQGMLSSVKCGFRSLPSSCSAAMVFLGDQPMISFKTTDRVIEGYISSGKGIVVPVFEGKRGHPLLIDMKYRKEIELLDDGAGLRSLLTRFKEDILEIPVDDPGILRDIDTKDEYQNEINKTQ
jgi:molybdenum cofactor cytidylyltransferase